MEGCDWLKEVRVGQRMNENESGGPGKSDWEVVIAVPNTFPPGNDSEYAHRSFNSIVNIEMK